MVGQKYQYSAFENILNSGDQVSLYEGKSEKIRKNIYISILSDNPNGLSYHCYNHSILKQNSNDLEKKHKTNFRKKLQRLRDRCASKEYYTWVQFAINVLFIFPSKVMDPLMRNVT